MFSFLLFTACCQPPTVNEHIRDPLSNEGARVIDHRLLVAASSSAVSQIASERGELFGIGTGRIFLPANWKGFLLWWQNDNPDRRPVFVQKFIAGWENEDVKIDSKVFSLIWYMQTEPNGNRKTAPGGSDNIGAGKPLADMGLRAYAWDEDRTDAVQGLKGMQGGFAAIPNTVSSENSNPIWINGEIIIQPGSSQSFWVNTRYAGWYHFTVICYFKPINDVG